MIQLVGIAIVLIMVGYIIKIAGAALKVPEPIITLLLLLIALIFVVAVLSTIGALPPSWRLLP